MSRCPCGAKIPARNGRGRQRRFCTECVPDGLTDAEALAARRRARELNRPRLEPPPEKTEAEDALEWAYWYKAREEQFRLVYRKCRKCRLYAALLSKHCIQCENGIVPPGLRTAEARKVLGRL